MRKQKQDIQGKGMELLMKVYGSEFAEKYKLRGKIDKLTYTGVKRGFKSVAALSAKKSGKKNNKKPSSSKKKSVFNVLPSEEQTMVCEAIQRFAKEQMRPAAYLADKQALTPEEIFENSLELGLAYLAVPESLGGASNEYEPITSVLVAEQLAWGDMSMAYALLSPLAFANAIRRWGTDEQQQEYLSKFVQEDGSLPPKAVVAVQEEATVFNPHQLKTTAKKSGNGYVLTGHKALLPLGGKANYYLVAANYKNQIRLFIVPGDANGLSWQDSPAMGLKAAQTGSLTLNKVKLDKEALLGGGSKSTFIYKDFIDCGRLHTAAMAVGCCQAVLDYIVPYINEREAFGEPISHRQSVAFLAADMALEIEGMRLMLWRAASLAQQGKDFHEQAALAMHLCATKAMQVGTNGVQLLGGHGFTKEHPVERWYRDLRAIAVLHGLHA